MNRRELMKSAVTAAMAPLVVPASALGRQGSVPPSDRITVGAIGIGNRARLDLSQLLPQNDARVVAVCDVNSNARDAGLTLVNKQYGDKGCREYRDFRELLAQKDIDAVMIASPDHWHVPMMTAAAKAGKDIFAEKPMGLAIAWTQAAREAVLGSGVVFQWGAHQHTHRMYEHAMRVVHSGKIGALKVVRAWVPSSEWSGDRPAALPKVVPVPDYLDWDMWQGPGSGYHLLGRQGTRLVRKVGLQPRIHLQLGSASSRHLPVGHGAPGRPHHGSERLGLLPAGRRQRQRDRLGRNLPLRPRRADSLREPGAAAQGMAAALQVALGTTAWPSRGPRAGCRCTGWESARNPPVCSMIWMFQRTGARTKRSTRCSETSWIARATATGRQPPGRRSSGGT